MVIRLIVILVVTFGLGKGQMPFARALFQPWLRRPLPTGVITYSVVILVNNNVAILIISSYSYRSITSRATSSITA